ncbi:MAG: phosphatidylglycerophosphatase A [Proteobacteria bacterium]|nr:phosphatidylglycerophosphatase A [Pseudomonadota bacterium]
MQEKNSVSIANQVFKHPYLFVACGFGVGLIRPGPGTWGTLVALPIHYLLGASLSVELLLLFWVVMFLVGIKICAVSETILGHSDHSAIVIDEIVAFGIILALIPQNMIFHVLGFIVFRIFDILKPFGIRLIDQRVKGGLGVMLDDLVAAVYTLCAFTVFVPVVALLGTN